MSKLNKILNILNMKENFADFYNQYIRVYFDNEEPNYKSRPLATGIIKDYREIMGETL